MEIINILYRFADYSTYDALNDTHFINVNYMQYTLRDNKVLRLLNSVNNNT